jgi:hypothetical protein
LSEGDDETSAVSLVNRLRLRHNHRMRRLTFAFWNVTNLFEPGAGARGPQSEAELTARVERLANVLGRVDEGRGPHLLGLAEVGTERILDALRRAMPSEYTGLWEPSPRADLTGLGLLLRADRFAGVQRIDAERPMLLARPRTLLVHCELVGRREAIVVAVCHWKSRLPGGGDPTSDRLASGRWLAEHLATLDRDTCVVVMGDFNAEPHEPPFADAGLRARRHFSPVLSGTASPVHLYNTAWRQLAEPDYWEDLVVAGMRVSRPRTSHDSSPPVVFDQLLVSGASLKLGPVRLLERSVRLHMVDGVNSVRRASGNLVPLRWEYNATGKCIGCADHYPLLADFEMD